MKKFVMTKVQDVRKKKVSFYCSCVGVELLAREFSRFPKSAVMGVTPDLQPYYYAITGEFRLVTPDLQPYYSTTPSLGSSG